MKPGRKLKYMSVEERKKYQREARMKSYWKKRNQELQRRKNAEGLYESWISRDCLIYRDGHWVDSTGRLYMVSPQPVKKVEI